MELTISIILCAVGVVGSIVGLSGSVRNRDADKGVSVKQITELVVKVGMILEGISEIKLAASKTNDAVAQNRNTIVEVRSLAEQSKNIAEQANQKIEDHIKNHFEWRKGD